jgi:hypothetical protein
MRKKKRKPKTVIIPRLRLRERAPLLSHTVVLLALASGPQWAPPARASQALPQGKRPAKPYALIYGTVFGPDDHTVYGVRIKIRPASEKKPRWELYSDHSGEFAQRVPAGQADYVIWADLKGFKLLDGKKLQAGQEVTVHVQNDERADISLHLK